MLSENNLRIAVDVVFDCNLYLRSVASVGSPSADCLALLGTNKISVFVSRDILEEIEWVLLTSELQSKFPRLTQETTEALIGRLRQDAIFIHNVPETFRYPRDPNDEMYVNLALVTDAQYLVTFDKDLLDLMGENEAGRDFRPRFPDLQIVDPLRFLEAIRAE